MKSSTASRQTADAMSRCCPYDDSEEVLEGEDEVLPLKVIEEDGETYLTMIEDDDEFEEVYQAFEERLSDLFFDDERTDSESEEDGE